MYAKDRGGFKNLLDQLLKEVVLNELWVGEWLETVLDVFGGCMGRPSRLEMGLKAFRARRGTELTKEEKDLIFVLDAVLEVNKIWLKSVPSESDSSDSHEATSSLYAGDNENQGLVQYVVIEQEVVVIERAFVKQKQSSRIEIRYAAHRSEALQKWKANSKPWAGVFVLLFEMQR